MMKMAREMQGQMKEIKKNLAHQIFEGSSHGVVAKVSGDLELKELKIDAKIVDQSKVDQLEKHVHAAVSQALKSARDGAAKQLKGLTGGLGLPGM